MASKEIRGLFMTVADEADFSLHLRAGVERVAILDGKDGPDGRPFEIASISDASGPQAWIFERRDDAPLQWKSLLGELARSLMRATRTNHLVAGMSRTASMALRTTLSTRCSFRSTGTLVKTGASYNAEGPPPPHGGSDHLDLQSQVDAVCAGKISLNVLPLPTSLDTSIRPPCASTSRRAL